MIRIAPCAGRAIDPEGCDDGNTEDGDGCSSECTVEKGFYCVGGNRFAADQCRNLNQSLYFRRKDRRGPSWLGEDADLEMPDGSLYLGPHSEQGAEPPSSERDPEISNANSRQDGNHTRRQYAGSIVVSINVEFNPATSDEGNNTMYIRHLHQSLMHPDFLRRFQEAMREQDTPVVVAWTEYVQSSAFVLFLMLQNMKRNEKLIQALSAERGSPSWTFTQARLGSFIPNSWMEGT